MKIAYVLAWMAPILLGGSLVALAEGRPRTATAWARVLGCGTVLGLLTCAAMVGLLGSIESHRILPIVLPVLLLLALGTGYLAWRRPVGPESPVPVPARLHPLAFILVALLLAHAWMIAGEVLLRPPYPWDAWAVWTLKPKAWMLGGRVDPFVGFGQWLADPTGHLRTADAWGYPEAIPHLGIWFVQAWGEWNAIAFNVAWLVLWLALLMGCHGQLRSLGLQPNRSLVATYALGSLPLINTHAALAGYADLWIASILAFACLAWLRWLERRERGDLWLALAFALLLPTIKHEGVVWLLIVAGMMVYACLPARWRRIALAGAPLVGAACVLAYLMRWPLITAAFDAMGLSADRDAPLAHAPAALGAAVTGLFAQYNWHLFGFAVLLTLALRWRSLMNSPSMRLLGLLLLLGCGFLFVLFVLTPAGRWAESYTVVNRLGMQMVPAMLVFAALLWRDPLHAVARTDVAPRMVVRAPSGP